MTKEELNFIGSMNMCDEISNKAYQKIVNHFEETQPSEDCVSRKSLLDKLDPLYKEKIKTAPDNMAEGFMQVSNLIKYEPPVTPTRKVGKWIEKKSFGDWKDYLKCSCCGYSTYDEEKEDCTEFLYYCPNCGAEMVKE